MTKSVTSALADVLVNTNELPVADAAVLKAPTVEGVATVILGGSELVEGVKFANAAATVAAAVVAPAGAV